MKDKRMFERHEYMYGPHFTEECATKVVSKMLNEDGTMGLHWSLAETTAVASKYGVSFSPRKYNKYDWYVALNMVYSDYYKFVIDTLHSNDVKYFVELAKAWLDDKDVTEGKMWYYYKYVINTIYHDIEEEEEEDEDEDYDDYEYPRRSRYIMTYRRPYAMKYDYDEAYSTPKEKEYNYRRTPMHERIGSRY